MIMLKKSRKYLYLFIGTIIVTILIYCTSCSQNADDTKHDINVSDNNNIIDVTELETNYLESGKPDIPAMDYGGYEFRVLSNDDGSHAIPLHTRDIISEKETAEPINDAVYRRNTEVEEKFNIVISNIALPESDGYAPANALKNSVLAGEDAYDLLITYAPGAAQAATNGHLMNWNVLPYIDMSKPWWFQGAVNNLSVGDKIFISLSDMSISTMHYVYMVYFNKQLHNDFEVENLYDLVSNGTWTFDKVSEVTKGITSDINGNGEMDDNDRYGAIVSYAALNFFYAGGNMLTAKDENNYPYFDIVTERSVSAFEKAYDICHSDYVRFAPDWQNENEMRDIFKSGQSLLYFHSLSKIDSLRDMEIDFGVIPYPKLDESQTEYNSYIDLHNPLMGVPITVNDLERTGAIIEELSYLSRKYLVPAYYETTLKTKFTRDEDSIEMLDIIRDGVVFDFGCVYDVTTAFIFQNQINAGNREYISAIESRLPAAQNNLDKVIEAYENAQG